MSSWLYRPTPVVAWGRGPFASQNVLNGWTGGTMRGVVPGWNYAPGLGKAKAARTARQPWIKLSGTMGDFIPNGLGGAGLGDDSTDFYSGADASPVIPDSVPIVPFAAPDLNPTFSPTAPDFSGGSIPSSFFAGAFAGPSVPTPPAFSAITPPTFPPSAGAGPTGTGIPGTQPVSPAALVSSGTGLLNSIKNFFTPSAPKNVPTTNYANLPGYGGAKPSFLAQSTILPGTPNSTVLLGGLAVVVLLGALGASGGKRR